MSEKMTCAGCGSHMSSILRAFQEGEPCPVCGLSAEAALEIEGVRKSRADEVLKAKLETALLERDAATRQAAWATTRLSEVERHLEALLGRVREPLQPEEDR